MRSLISLLLCLCTVITPAIPVYQNDSLRQIYCSAPNNEKKIALTFDDGPHPKYTEEILDILQKYNVKATFFAIGENITYYPETFEKIILAGHEIGNHTFSHPHMQNEDIHTLKKELQQTEDLLRQKGVTTTLFRPPEGVCSDAVCRVAKELSYSIILWTVDTKDWSHPGSDDIVDLVQKHIKSGDIILFHDYIQAPSPTPQALDTLIPALLAKGYHFVTVSELISA